jgi:hypothetical protein
MCRGGPVCPPGGRPQLFEVGGGVGNIGTPWTGYRADTQVCPYIGGIDVRCEPPLQTQRTRLSRPTFDRYDAAAQPQTDR